MKRTLLIALLTILSLAFVTPQGADAKDKKNDNAKKKQQEYRNEAAKRKEAAEAFKKLDKDGSNALSEDEFTKGKSGKSFAEADKNKNGSISRSEFEDAMVASAKKKKK